MNLLSSFIDDKTEVYKIIYRNFNRMSLYTRYDLTIPGNYGYLLAYIRPYKYINGGRYPLKRQDIFLTGITPNIGGDYGDYRYLVARVNFELFYA